MRQTTSAPTGDTRWWGAIPALGGDRRFGTSGSWCAGIGNPDGSQRRVADYKLKSAGNFWFLKGFFMYRVIPVGCVPHRRKTEWLLTDRLTFDLSTAINSPCLDKWSLT